MLLVVRLLTKSDSSASTVVQVAAHVLQRRVARVYLVPLGFTCTLEVALPPVQAPHLHPFPVALIVIQVV